MGSNSSKKVSRTIYGNTTTSNPYAYSKTDNKGTTAGFLNGTAMQSVYDIVNKSAESLLNEYINPNPDSAYNKSKIKSFSDTLAEQTGANLENDIINPLSRRNMLRSSQATDLYRNLLNQNIASVANYTNDLYTNSSAEIGKKLSNLLSMYMLGANYLSNMQNHSLKASSGNSTKYSSTEGGSSNINNTLLPYIIGSLMATI